MSITLGQFLSALDAKQVGQQYMARCVAHIDDTPSLSITERDGRAPLYCFGGCEQDDVIDELTRRELWPVETAQSKSRQKYVAQQAGGLELPPGLIEFAADLIRPEHGVMRRYLRLRGLDAVADLVDIAQHPQAWHKPTDTWWPCMVAAVRDHNDRLRSLHRTWLYHLDPPQKAPIEPNRMLYGGAPCAGCAIHLTPAGPVLLLGEGLESTSSAMKVLGVPNGWAAISSTHMKIVRLPDCVREVVIAADNDPPGLAAATTAALRFRREGRQVRIVKPGTCNDFNDVLMQRLGMEVRR